MLVQFKCQCGNDDPKQTKHHDGLIGYEADVCKKCARYADHEGWHDANEWSRDFVNLKTEPRVRILVSSAILFSMENRIFKELVKSTGDDGDVLDCRTRAEGIIRDWVAENNVTVTTNF